MEVVLFANVELEKFYVKYMEVVIFVLVEKIKTFVKIVFL
jgi:hypothetical protein